jgi:phospholipase A1
MHTKRTLPLALFVTLLSVLFGPEALSTESSKAMRDCLVGKIEDAAAEVTVGALRQACTSELQASSAPSGEITETPQHQHMRNELRSDQSSYSLTGYKQNYILPLSYVAQPNPLYAESGTTVNHTEMKFQFSFRFPLSSGQLFVDGGGLEIGYTQKSFWQAYNSASAPFRESNYNPEIFYTMPLKWRPHSGDMGLRLGLEHESNGRGIVDGVNLSRSWNRAYAMLIFAKDDYVIRLRPWYRFPEHAKSSPTDASGDDNPDIEKYLGYFDLTGAFEYRHFEFSLLARDNLRSSTNYGAIELGMSFPLYHEIRGYAQYFSGYGESLIDYNHYISRIGVGFMLTDMLPRRPAGP